MTYASTGLIQATDFNNLAWGTNTGGEYITTATPNLAFIHGTGYGRMGLGQSTSAYTQVVTTNTVSATQWTGLLNGVNAVLGLQGAATIAPASVVSGDVITYYSTISSGTVTANTSAALGTVGSRTNSTTWTGSGTNVRAGTTDWGSQSNRLGRFTITASWSNGDLARYWWNAGGALDVSLSISPTTGTTRIVDWAALLTAVGTVRIGYSTATKIGGSGTPTTIRSSAGTGGYWVATGIGTTSPSDHPGAGTLQFQQFDTASGYTSDYVSISTTYSGTRANGAFPTMVITVDLGNAYINANQDSVGAIPTVQVLIQNPVTTALAVAPTAPTITATFADL
jgi:hypothetical protein